MCAAPQQTPQKKGPRKGDKTDRGNERTTGTNFSGGSAKVKESSAEKNNSEFLLLDTVNTRPKQAPRPRKELMSRTREESLCAFGDRRIYSQTTAGQETHVNTD